MKSRNDSNGVHVTPTPHLCCFPHRSSELILPLNFWEYPPDNGVNYPDDLGNYKKWEYYFYNYGK
jgi:hypothetical protein